MIAFDTNVYAYALDADSMPKRQKAIDLLQSHAGSSAARPLLWQVACEFLAFLCRQKSKGRIDDASISLEMNGLLSNHQLITPTPDVLPLSIDLKTHYSLSHWDSLLLAACISAGVTTLYSEDMSHGMTCDAVTVINPLLPA